MDKNESNKLNKSKKQKRDIYLNSAISVFSEKGFNDARVQDITKRAGTSVGNFYRYFESKDEIFILLMEEFAKIITEKFVELNEKYEIPPLDELKALFKGYIHMFEEKEKIAHIYIVQMGGINKKFELMKKKYQNDFVDEVEKLMDRLVKLKFIRKQNPRITAQIWVSTLMQAYQWWIQSGKKEDLDEVIDEVLNFLVKGTITK